MLRNLEDFICDVCRYLPADKREDFVQTALHVRCGVAVTLSDGCPIDFVPLGFQASNWDEIEAWGLKMLPKKTFSMPTSQWMGERYPRQRDGMLRVNLELWRFDSMPQPEEQETRTVAWYEVPEILRRVDEFGLRELETGVHRKVGGAIGVPCRLQPVVKPSLRETWEAWKVELIPVPLQAVEVELKKEIIERKIVFDNLFLGREEHVQRQEISCVRISLLVAGEIAVAGADYRWEKRPLENPPQIVEFELCRAKLNDLSREEEEVRALASYKRWREVYKLFRGNGVPRRAAKRFAYKEKQTSRLRDAELLKEIARQREIALRFLKGAEEWEEKRWEKD